VVADEVLREKRTKVLEEGEARLKLEDPEIVREEMKCHELWPQRGRAVVSGSGT
jgi:hypothetical protein